MTIALNRKREAQGKQWLRGERELNSTDFFFFFL